MTSLEVCTPHPSALFSRETTDLLSSIAAAPVVAVGPPKGATSLEQIVAAMEQKRRSLGVERWVIWGMSVVAFWASSMRICIQLRLRVSFWRVPDPVFEPR